MLDAMEQLGRVPTRHRRKVAAAAALAGTVAVQLRVRGRTRPWWLTAAYVAALVPADHLMAGSMLGGIRRLVAAVP
jgi:hypothetical protein